MKNNQCVNCGGTPEQVTETAWTDLHVYKFTPYPDTLYIITTANEKEFEKAVETFSNGAENGDPQNIDCILQDMGHVALCSGNRLVEVPF